MPDIDETRRMDEERAEDLRERDRQREPLPRRHRPRRELAGRDAFRIKLAESCTLTVTGPATGDGTASLHLHGESIDVEVKDGDDVRAIAMAIADQLDATGAALVPAGVDVSVRRARPRASWEDLPAIPGHTVNLQLSNEAVIRYRWRCTCRCRGKPTTRIGEAREGAIEHVREMERCAAAAKGASDAAR